MLISQAIAPADRTLSEIQIEEILLKGLEGRFRGQRLLILIPDHTRSLPLPFLFREFAKILHDAKSLDFMVALGTHPPLSMERLNQLVGITAEERVTTYKDVGLLNHNWNDPGALATIGRFAQDEIKQIAGPYWHSSLPDEVEIRLNKAALAHDHIIMIGPTFPHEVAGFSGGAKYLFPGISGPEMINATHWLGALAGVVGTIGIKGTPVRTMIHTAAQKLSTPVTLVGLVVREHELAGIFVGDMLDAWNAAADLSSQLHINWCDKPFRRVLSCALPIYDELWTAAKAMYKLEPAVAMGGEVVIYAPHLDKISDTHGKFIYQIGYHILPYFLRDWERFKHIPLGVLAHSTHVRGSGRMEGGEEKPNVRVTLASRISAEDCGRLNLGYLDPDGIKVEEWLGREGEGVLCVPKAGEILYRLKRS